MKKIIKKSVTEQVIEIILDRIDNGIYTIGEQLPSQEAFAKELEVSRVSVREALVQLQCRGILDIRQGEGTFLTASKRITDIEDSIREIYNSKNEVGAFAYILEVRRIVEQHTVELAIERAKTGDIAQLEDILKDMETITDLTDFFSHDLEFHLQIARISQNPILYRLLETIRYSFWDVLLMMPGLNNPVAFKMINAAHRNIYNALVSKDKEKAVHYILEHMEGPEKLILKFLQNDYR